jgi:hypothetical protein
MSESNEVHIENAEHVDIENLPTGDDGGKDGDYEPNAPGEQDTPGDDEPVEDRTEHTDESDMRPGEPVADAADADDEPE